MHVLLRLLLLFPFIVLYHLLKILFYSYCVIWKLHHSLYITLFIILSANKPCLLFGWPFILFSFFACPVKYGFNFFLRNDCKCWSKQDAKWHQSAHQFCLAHCRFSKVKGKRGDILGTHTLAKASSSLLNEANPIKRRTICQLQGNCIWVRKVLHHWELNLQLPILIHFLFRFPLHNFC